MHIWRLAAIASLTALVAGISFPASSAAFGFNYAYLAPVDQSGTYQIDCPTWRRSTDTPLRGCTCPQRADYLTLTLTDVEQLPYGISSHTIRMHYTGQLREVGGGVYRSPCQGGDYTCLRWIGDHIYPLSGYFDWNYDVQNGVYHIDPSAGVSGVLTTSGPEFMGFPIETNYTSVTVVPVSGQEDSKTPGDTLVALIVNRDGLRNGSGGWDTQFSPQTCRCPLTDKPDVTPTPYPHCGQEGWGGGGQLGVGSYFYTGDQTVLPTINGEIAVKLRSSLDLTMPDPAQDPRSIERATATLYLQAGYVRAQRAGESDTDYRSYISTLERSPVGKPIVVTAAYDSLVSWKDVASNQLVEAGGSSMWQDLYYTVEITEAETDELDLNQDNNPLDPNLTVTTFFTGGAKYNLKPDLAAPIDEHRIEVTPFDGIGTKEGLVTSLSKICPDNYTTPENLVQLYLNQLKDGSVAQTPEHLEGLKRAILAERTVLFGARFGRDLIDAFMDGFSNLLQNLVEELTDKKGAGKGLAKRKKAMEGLEKDSQILKSRLSGRGWNNFDQANLDSVKSDMDVLGDTNSMLIHKIAGAIKVSLKYTFAAIRASLVAANIDGGKISDFIDVLQAVVFTALDAGIHQGVGSTEQFVKFVIKQVAERAKGDLFDSIFPGSYSALTAPDLTYSQQLMESWNNDNLSLYQGDRNIVDFWLNRLGSEATDALVTATYAGFANDAADLVETAGDLGKAHPVGRFAKIAGKISKYAANGVQFVVPAKMVLRTYDLTGTAVEAAFSSTPRPAFTSLAAGGSGVAVLAARNSNLLAEIDQAELSLATLLGQLSDQLRDDLIADAIALSSGNAGDTLRSVRTRLERAMSHFILEATEVAPLGISANNFFAALAPQQIAIEQQLADLVEDLIEHYLKVLSLEYTGPSDPLYAAERGRLLAAIATLQDATGTFASVAADFSSATAGTQNAEVQPVVVIDALTVRSDASGSNAITTSPESFSITAHIVNLSSAPLAELSALITVHSPAGSVTLNSATELAVGSGTLGAGDGSYAGGADEADVAWNFTFDGDLGTRERIVFVVELLEAGATPESFTTMSALELLRYDITIRDADLDGVPDDWEIANSLDPSVDDADADPDGDGVANWREYELGTTPTLADSDGDGLSDGEETTGGIDGYLTDPLSTDTDGDGSSDDTDSNPLDANPAAAAGAPGEPIVALDVSAVSISESQRFAVVTVSNAGSGTLTWTAVSSNKALAVTSPNESGFGGDGAKLVVRLASSFEDIGACVDTTVRVVDLGGATKDYQDIDVTVTSAAGCQSVTTTTTLPTTTCGDATGDGRVTASDALMALQAAVGIGSCALNRCDANGDGRVSATDSLLVLNFAVGIPVSLNCGP